MRSVAAPNVRAELVRRLRTVRTDSAARWGRMSAHQMVCHLGDALLMAVGEKHVTLDANPFKRTVLKWVALYLPVPWPPGIPTSPEIDQLLIENPTIDFAADVARVETLLEAMVVRARDLALVPHPYFGRMSSDAWLRWGYLHMDHHLRQFGA